MGVEENSRLWLGMVAVGYDDGDDVAVINGRAARLFLMFDVRFAEP